jgi:hypothetical protein
MGCQWLQEATLWRHAQAGAVEIGEAEVSYKLSRVPTSREAHLDGLVLKVGVCGKVGVAEG